MNAGNTYPITLVQAIRHFSDLNVAQDFFVKIRWPDGVTCPHCGSTEVHYLANQRRWKCKVNHPKRQFSAKVGTIFEDSPLDLDKWLVAVWIEVNAKNSVSSCELHRALGITQKSAWFMLHRVRAALKNGSFEKMGGSGNPIEADETWVGGLAKNMHLARRRKKIHGALGGKTPIMGLLERHTDKPSQVRVKVVEGTSKTELYPVIHKNVERGATIYTDAWRAYRQLPPDFVHAFVDHMEKYVDGAVHTNGLENFWSLFNRCIAGTHVSVDPVHLEAYVDSEAFRFNNRKLNDGQRLRLALRGVTGRRLTYKALIGALEERKASGDKDAGSAESLPS
jgi:transposase-like protein